MLMCSAFMGVSHMLTPVQVRGLAHRGHWQGPLGPVFERFGAVKASPLAAFRLLSQGEAVLLYPGGGKEASHAFPYLLH